MVGSGHVMTLSLRGWMERGKTGRDGKHPNQGREKMSQKSENHPKRNKCGDSE